MNTETPLDWVYFIIISGITPLCVGTTERFRPGPAAAWPEPIAQTHKPNPAGACLVGATIRTPQSQGNPHQQRH